VWVAQDLEHGFCHSELRARRVLALFCLPTLWFLASKLIGLVRIVVVLTTSSRLLLRWGGNRAGPAWSAPGGLGSRPNQWWPYNEDMSTPAESFRGVALPSIRPTLLVSVCAIILNLLIPTDLVDETEVEIEEMWHMEEKLE
jgi:hypothetical protein